MKPPLGFAAKASVPVPLSLRVWHFVPHSPHSDADFRYDLTFAPFSGDTSAWGCPWCLSLGRYRIDVTTALVVRREFALSNSGGQLPINPLISQLGLRGYVQVMIHHAYSEL